MELRNCISTAVVVEIYNFARCCLGDGVLGQEEKVRTCHRIFVKVAYQD